MADADAGGRARAAAAAAADAAAPAHGVADAAQSPARAAWLALRRNRAALAGAAVVLLMALACCLGPPLLAHVFDLTYEAQDLAYGARPPSLQHPCGTDFHGRDLLARLLTGGQISLGVGFFAAAVAASIGTAYGGTAGAVGGAVDAAMMRLVDVIYALPYMFLLIVMTTLLGRSLVLLFVALGMTGWLTTARIVRGQVMALKQRDFVLAARALGVGEARIVLRHLVPNTLGPIIVYFTLTVPTMILEEAFLSFLGLGVQAPRPSLGSLISDGAAQMAVFWWMLAFPAGCMALLLLALNFFGDGLRDALDPRLRR